jgi:hypothetical protein
MVAQHDRDRIARQRLVRREGQNDRDRENRHQTEETPRHVHHHRRMAT